MLHIIKLLIYYIENFNQIKTLNQLFTYLLNPQIHITSIRLNPISIIYLFRQVSIDLVDLSLFILMRNH